MDASTPSHWRLVALLVAGLLPPTGCAHIHGATAVAGADEVMVELRSPDLAVGPDGLLARSTYRPLLATQVVQVRMRERTPLGHIRSTVRAVGCAAFSRHTMALVPFPVSMAPADLPTRGACVAEDGRVLLSYLVRFERVPASPPVFRLVKAQAL